MTNIEPTRQSLGVVLVIVALDSAGIGLTLPIIPRLLSDVGHTANLGWRFGAFLSVYALMQFVFSPIQGSGATGSAGVPSFCCPLPAPRLTIFSWRWHRHW